MDLGIVEELKIILEKESGVHAMWIAGSVAEGYNDELSDVDIWLDIDDGTDVETFKAIERFLKTRGNLDVNFGENNTPPFSHKVYHLSHMEPYHFIEFTLHSHKDNYEFIDGVRKIKLLFDKDGTVKFKPLNKASHAKMLKSRKNHLVKQIEIGKLSARKEITRRQFMDALHNYQFWLVEPIIELARIKYSPLKISYGLKHGNRDLPKDVTAKIESLYIIKSLDDLDNKINDIGVMVNEYS